MRRSNLLLPLPLLVTAALSLVACGDDAETRKPVDTADTSTTDAADASSGVDTTPDEPDAPADEPDAIDDVQADPETDAPEDTTPDDAGSGDDASPDDASPDVGPDVEPDVELDTAPEDAGTDCTDDPSVCVAPWACIENVCRQPLAGSIWAETAFELREPEELVRLFDFIKSVGNKVRFIVIDVQPGELPPYTTFYGAADEVVREPAAVAWQFPDELKSFLFRPLVDPEWPLVGESWTSDPFTYDFSARLSLNFGASSGIFVVGFTAEKIRFTVTPTIEEVDGLPVRRMTGTMDGYVTRAETMRRIMTDDPTTIEFIKRIYCTNRQYNPPFTYWRFADLLDCNNAPMDHDIDEDGLNDSYHVVLDLQFAPAELVDAPIVP